MLLEEAAIDGIPAIVIDPKGDLCNLLLTFPELRPVDFEPWITESTARQKGISTREFAGQQADLWKKGLASWGQDGERIKRLRAAADFAIYTPGSEAGLQVSLSKSFDAPAVEARSDRESMRESVMAAVSSLLGLLGVNADPLQSREHILLSTIFDSAWSEGRNLDLPTLIALVQNPPFRRVGMFELESFYPSKDRFGLAQKAQCGERGFDSAAAEVGEPCGPNENFRHRTTIRGVARGFRRGDGQGTAEQKGG